MANKLNNCYLINAPAGSGKTTEIKSMVQRCIIDNPKDNILCITYTNRAADELSKGILSKNVFIGTIHSFLHFFLKSYFAHQDILELYFEIYGAQISERIDNKSQKESIAESNARYIEKYGKLDYDMVRNNIKVLSYNESPFSSLYYGGLSHDDLIGFSKAIFNRYPVIKKRMTSKYQFIFIDEYQDTMSDVLKIFFESVHNTKTIVDIIENWDKLSFTEEQADKIVEKIDHVCKMDLFQVIMKEREDGKGPIMDCSSLQTALRKSGIPVSNVRRQTIEMWQYWQVKDITGMIGAFENMFVESEAAQKEKADNGVLDLETIFDGVILGSMVNYILEESNLEQCTKILDIMNLVVEKNDNSTFVDMIAKWKDNFEGKKMMIEMGEE